MHCRCVIKILRGIVGKNTCTVIDVNVLVTALWYILLSQCFSISRKQQLLIEEDEWQLTHIMKLTQEWIFLFKTIVYV